MEGVQTSRWLQKAPVQEYKENYGAWMLVTRKERRGQRRGGYRPPEPPATTNRQATPMNMESDDLRADSQFAILDRLNGNDTDHPQEVETT